MKVRRILSIKMLSVALLILLVGFSGCGKDAPEIMQPEPGRGADMMSAAVGAHGRTLHVKPDGTGKFVTIQDAIDAARDGDVILLAKGVFRGDGNRDLDYLGKAITIRSQGQNSERCIIDCEGSETDPHRAVNFVSGEGPDSRLEGVTIINGFVLGDSPEGLGGGIFCRGSSPTLDNLTLVGNTAHNGGGVACRDGASPTIRECQFLENDATTYFDGDGGGLHCSVESSPAVYDCVFANNKATSWGGGLFCLVDSSPELYNCTFFGNSASNGGGIGADRGTSSPKIVSSIIAFNAGGGAVRCQLGAIAEVSCSDVFSNAGGDFASCITGQEGVDGNFSADPQFCSAADDDFSLAKGSPCLPGRRSATSCGVVGAVGQGCNALPEPDECGVSWTKSQSNPFIMGGFSGGTFDAMDVRSTSVLYDPDDNNYKMWYSGLDRSSPPRARIGYATSPDGLSWTPYGPNPVINLGSSGAFDDWHAYFPVVIKDGSIFKMWYTGDAYAVFYLGYATSVDGMNWTKYAGSKYGGSIIDWVSEGWDRYTPASSVIKDGSVYKMWFGEYGAGGGIGYATSNDGVNWTIVGQVLSVGANGTFEEWRIHWPSVVKNGSQYLMVYAGQNSAELRRFGFATSPDGINWTKYASNPMLPLGNPGEMDDVTHYYPNIVLENDALKMWYSGSGLGLAIGYAESRCSGFSRGGDVLRIVRQ